MPGSGGNNNPDGNNQHIKGGQSDNITLTKEDQPNQSRGTSPSYISKRLKRDNPA